VGGAALRYGGPIAAAAIGTQAIADATHDRYGPGPFSRKFWHSPSLIDVIRGKGHMSAENKEAWRNVGRDISHAASWAWHHHWGGGGLLGMGGGNKTTPILTIDLNVKQPDGSKQRVRVHVPPNLFANGNVPSSAGKVSVGRR
jgi:hypothetical protein